jgi:Uma2 family endonuclease
VRVRSAARRTPAPRHADVEGPFTYADFCALLPGKQKGDLIDGTIYMASPDSTSANELNAWLAAIMEVFVRRMKLGNIYISRVACRLDDKNAPEPAIAFVRTEHLDRVECGGIVGPADLAVEIVSPDSIERDYEKKFRQYKRFGISEYWIVDDLSRVVRLFRLSAAGRYREVRPKKGVLTSAAMPGFWLKPEWLWQTPLPDPFDTIALLLNEPRAKRGKDA